MDAQPVVEAGPSAVVKRFTMYNDRVMLDEGWDATVAQYAKLLLSGPPSSRLYYALQHVSLSVRLSV